MGCPKTQSWLTGIRLSWFSFFAETEYHLRPEKITLTDFNVDFIAAFLRWLEQERGCGVATRNQRLAAMRAFARYARTQHPAYLFESQKIMDLKAKKAPTPTIAYLSPDDVLSIFGQTDTYNKNHPERGGFYYVSFQ